MRKTSPRPAGQVPKKPLSAEDRSRVDPGSAKGAGRLVWRRAAAATKFPLTAAKHRHRPLGPTAASSCHKRALVRIPRWKSASDSFSLGLWALSSSKPHPIRSVSACNRW